MSVINSTPNGLPEQRCVILYEALGECVIFIGAVHTSTID
jgi:hypothetical protein